MAAEASEETKPSASTAGPAPAPERAGGDAPELNPSPSRLKFGPEHRIRKRSEFLRVYQQGRKAHGRHATVFCRARDEGPESPWRLGITATRKMGKAVRRNRQRRRVREWFRTNQGWIPSGWDFVVNTRASLTDCSFEELNRDLRGILRRLGFEPPAETTER